MRIRHCLFSAVLTLGPVAAWAQNQAADPRNSPMGMLISFLPILAFGAIFYFLLFRPQQQAQKERQKMLAAVGRNDKVLTSGGIYATVVGIRGDILDVKIADNVKVEINRSFVSKVIAATNGTAQAAAAEKKS